MKRNSNTRLPFSNVRVPILPVLLFAGIFSAVFAAASTATAQAAPRNLVFGNSPMRHLDEHGYRPGNATSPRSGDAKSSDATLAGTGAWSLLGPPGGNVTDAAVSTIDPNIVLAGTDTSLYRSVDGGTTWSEVPALIGTGVYDIEFAASGKVYIATLDSIRESNDGGVTWTPRNLGIGANDQVLDIALDPSNSSVLWAGIADASGAQPINVMRSVDGGVTWSNLTPPLGQAVSCQAIAVDPTNSNTVIAVFGGAFGGGQVWVTTNGGSSWMNRSAGLPNNPMQAVVYNGTRLLVGGGQLFGGQNVGLYQSLNLGMTWTPLHNNTWPRLVVTDIAVDPNDPQKILVATDGTGVHRTTNGGTSWEIGIGGTGALAARSLRFQPGSSTRLFLGTTSLAVFRSTDGGNTFTSSSRGISAIDLFSIHANPLNPTEIAVAFQGSNNGGVYSSTDGGATWKLESAPPTRYSAVRFAPNGTLYAISSGPSTVAPEGLYRRESNGSWTSLGPDQGTLFESDLATIRFSINNPNLILLGGADFGVAGFEGTIWRSTNAGGMWTKVDEFSSSQKVIDIEIVEDGLDQVMLAAYDDLSGGNQAGIRRSTTGGVSWVPSNSGLPTFLRAPHLCASPNDPQMFFLVGSLSFGSSGLFRSPDSGQSWVSTGWTGTGSANDIACHPNGQLLFVSLTSEGSQVVRSQNGGMSFSPFANGLQGVVNPRELAFAGFNRLVLASGKGSYGTDLGLPTPTPTATPIPTPTPTPTATPTATPSATPSPSATPTPTSTPSPTATASATPSATSTPSATATATATPSPAQALNISTRMRVETGNNVVIGGFIINGTAPKTVAVRGIGPSLSGFGIADVLADPTVELRASDGSLIRGNDNWQDDPAQAAQLTALGLAPTNSKESGLVAPLQPGAYTVIVAGKNQGTGVGLVEVYDTNQGGASQLANISTRGFVRTGENVMIGGFILGGSTIPTRVVVRGIGPSLAQAGLSPVLSDPVLELRDSNGALLISNDNWQDDPVSALNLIANGFALSDPKESGIFTSLPAGGFTAILAGKNGGIGIGLVEIYNLQ